jgi:hypothetical protein
MITIFSCETRTELNLPEIQPKIVLNSFFNPDSLFRINLTLSKLKNSRDFNLINKWTYINNADIRLFVDNEIITDFIFKNKGNFVSSAYKPIAGKEYTIQIKYTDYQEIEAKSLIPEKITIDSLYYSFIEDESGSKMLKVNIIWNDPPEQNFYYIFVIKEEQYYGYKESPAIFLRNNTIFGDWTTGQSLMVFDDKIFNNHYFNFDMLLNYDVAQFGPTYYIFYLVHLSKDFYLWAESQNRYFQQNTFFDEPVIVYNNIKNGLGIFAGCNISCDTISFNDY